MSVTKQSTGMSSKSNPAFERHQVEAYTDGGCEPNPGPGGYGVVLVHPKKRAEVSGGFRKTTNNRMEIFAAIVGLEMLKQPCKVTLYSDSQYLVEAMTEGWLAAWKRKAWWRTRTERPECGFVAAVGYVVPDTSGGISLVERTCGPLGKRAV
jgi:hypothetical protein